MTRSNLVDLSGEERGMCFLRCPVENPVKVHELCDLFDI